MIPFDVDFKHPAYNCIDLWYNCILVDNPDHSTVQDTFHHSFFQYNHRCRFIEKKKINTHYQELWEMLIK